MIYNMNGVEHGLGEGGDKKIGALYFKNVKIYDPPPSLENLKRRNLILESYLKKICGHCISSKISLKSPMQI